MPVNRYSNTQILLHWLVALMLIIGLVFGWTVIGATPNNDPEKLRLLTMHMGANTTLGLLILIRIVVRLRSQPVVPADAGSPLLNRLRSINHVLLYLLVLGMVGSGWALATSSGLADIVASGTGTLPADFHDFTLHTVHATIASLLTLLVLLHIAAALYHTFVLKDGLLSRMWIRKKREPV